MAAAPKSRPKTISMIGMAASETARAPPIVTQAVARKELRMIAVSACALSWANRDAVAIISGLVALYLPLLLVFVTGLHGLVERRGGAGADWSRLALAAGATVSAIFVLVNVLQIGVALSASGLAEPTPEFELVWQMHAAAFALALPTLGTTFIGAALAAHVSGLTQAWQRLLGLVGGSLLLAAGLGNLAIADGSALIFVGLLGFAAGLVWLLATGVRLVRS